MHIRATVCLDKAHFCGDVMLIAVCDRNIDDRNIDQSHIVLDFGDSVISVHFLAVDNPRPMPIFNVDCFTDSYCWGHISLVA